MMVQDKVIAFPAAALKFRVGLNWSAFSNSSSGPNKSNLTVLVLNAVTFDVHGRVLKKIRCPALSKS